MKKAEYEPLYSDIPPATVEKMPKQKRLAYDFANEIREKTGREIFTAYDPDTVFRFYGARVETACLILNAQEARIPTVKRKVTPVVIFHELDHLWLRWVARTPLIVLPDNEPQKWAEDLNNSFDHLTIVPKESRIFGFSSQKIWRDRYRKRFGSVRPASMDTFLRVATMRWLMTKRLLSSGDHVGSRETLERYGAFDRADKFADKILDLYPDRKAMVRFALKEFGFQGTRISLRTFDPISGTTNDEPVF